MFLWTWSVHTWIDYTVDGTNNQQKPKYILSEGCLISFPPAVILTDNAFLPPPPLIFFLPCILLLPRFSFSSNFPSYICVSLIKPVNPGSRMPLPQRNLQSWKSLRTEWAAWDTNSEQIKALLGNSLAFSAALDPGTYTSPFSSTFFSSLTPPNEVSSLPALILRTYDSQSLPSLWCKPWQQ